MSTENSTPAAPPAAPPSNSPDDKNIPPVVEGESKTTETASDKSAHKDFAALARKERHIREQQKSLIAEQDRLRVEAKKYEDWQRVIQNKRQDPIKALEALGLTFEDVQDYVVRGGKPTPQSEAKQLQEEVANLKRQQEDFLKAQEESRTRADNQKDREAAQTYFKGANDFVRANPEKYELTNSLKEFNLIEHTISTYAENTLKEKGYAEVMTYEEAADTVEKYLEARVAEQYEAISKTKKFSSKFNLPKKDEEEQKPSGSVPANRTISNDLTTTSASANPPKPGIAPFKGYNSGKKVDQTIAELVAKYGQ